MRIGLALHIIIVVGFASGTDEKAGAQEGGGRGAEFFDGRDGGGEGGCVQEDGLVESVGELAGNWGGMGVVEGGCYGEGHRLAYRGWRDDMLEGLSSNKMVFGRGRKWKSKLRA